MPWTSCPRSARSRATWRPVKPATPVMRVRVMVCRCSTIRSERKAGLIATQVRLDHQAAQLLQTRLRFPPQLLTRFRGVAFQQVDLGRSMELRIYAHDG